MKQNFVNQDEEVKDEILLLISSAFSIRAFAVSPNFGRKARRSSTEFPCALNAIFGQHQFCAALWTKRVLD